MNPSILICDEPTSALDVSVQAHILNLLIDLSNELNLTYVLVSHDLAVVELLADKVAVMYLGRLIEYGPGTEIFNHPRHPYTKLLLESVLTPEPGKGLPEIALGKDFPNPLNPPSGCAFHPRCTEATDRCKAERPALTSQNGQSVECHLYGD